LCGIAGVVFNYISSSSIEKTLDVLNNRGPDAHGVFFDDDVMLLHTRLSVIDLTKSASQPMTSSCGRFVIVFNGEIYNYQELKSHLDSDYIFQSSSDTEVILAYFSKYGTDMLQYLQGMFAFAIWDKLNRELFVARDRLGVKPLYFSSALKGFAFASRPQALTTMFSELKGAIDKQGLRYFLEAGYIPAPYSIFEGVSKLEPGHYLVVGKNGINKQQYWSIDGIQTDHSLVNADEDKLLDELDQLIEDSVKLRLVSDVDVGAFLSGGIDSSLVVAYMRKHANKKIQTFTIGFQDKKYDESIYAATVAENLGTTHYSEELAVNDLLELMPTFIKQYDEPFFDYSAFPVMAVSRLARRSVTVSLSGDGGDEGFGGYHYYQLMNKLEKLHKLPQILRKFIGLILQVIPKQRIRWLGKVISTNNAASAYAFMRGVMKDADNLMQNSLRTKTQSLADLFAQRMLYYPPNLSYAEIGMRLDLAYTLPDDYLQKVDIGSMAFSLEAREPLLDYKIIEWAAKLPLCWKIRYGVNKYLLRKLAYRYIPEEILDRPKMGFGLPMEQWLRGGLRDWGSALLENTDALDALELDAVAVRAMWNDHQSNKVQAHTILWSILVLLQFYKTHIESH
jgi:asparagine synthase (glutamine-hydrolysing)